MSHDYPFSFDPPHSRRSDKKRICNKPGSSSECSKYSWRLSAQRERLKQIIRSSEHQRLFDEARKRHKVLASHSTIYSVLALIDDDSKARYQEKDAVLRAFIAEIQINSDPLWSPLLIHMCFPMLSKLRDRIICRIFNSDALDQIVLQTFLEIVGNFPLRQKKDRTFMHLKQDIKRRVFSLIASEQRKFNVCEYPGYQKLESMEASEWPEVHHSVCLENDDIDEQIAILLDQIGHSLNREQLDLIINTLIRGVPLRRYVEQHYANHTDDERERICQRLKKRRQRIRKRLQVLLRDFKQSVEENRRDASDSEYF